MLLMPQKMPFMMYYQSIASSSRISCAHRENFKYRVVYFSGFKLARTQVHLNKFLLCSEHFCSVILTAGMLVIESDSKYFMHNFFGPLMTFILTCHRYLYRDVCIDLKMYVA